MNVEEVNERVAQIAQWGKGDPEASHSAEDKLHQDVLGQIADAHLGFHSELARAALNSLLIDFPRWCA